MAETVTSENTSAVAIQKQKLAEIATAIKQKDGSTGTIVADDFAERILAIPTGTDTSDATATAGDILSPKAAYVDGKKVTGTIAEKEAADVTVNGATVTIPAGYYKNQVAKSVTTVTHPAPTQALSLGTYATIRATHEQAAGYVSAGTTTADYTIGRNAGGTKTPGTSNQTLLSSGLVYLNNPLVMSGSSNLVSSNIRSGVNIFGIIGTYNTARTITLNASLTSYIFFVGDNNPSLGFPTNGFGFGGSIGPITFNFPSNSLWVIRLPSSYSQKYIISNYNESSCPLKTTLTVPYYESFSGSWGCISFGYLSGNGSSWNITYKTV